MMKIIIVGVEQVVNKEGSDGKWMMEEERE